MAVTLTSWRRWAALLAALTLALTLIPSSAQASKGGPEPGGEVGAEPGAGRLDLSAGIQLEEVTVHTRRGVWRDGGCEFSGTEVGGQDTRPVLERSISIDVSTCEMTLERGYVPDAEVHKVMEPGTDSGRNSWIGPSSATATERPSSVTLLDEGTDDVGTLQTRRREAWHRTWWRDPPGLVVNSVRPHVRWTYNGSCTSNGDWWTNYTWLTASGWSRQSSNTQAFSGCIAQTTSSYAHFRNGIFCLFIATHAYYDRTVVQGRPNGSYFMSWNSWVSGGCTGLLSFQRSHGWSQIF